MSTTGPSFGRRHARPIVPAVSKTARDSERDRLLSLSITSEQFRPSTRDGVVLEIPNSTAAGILTGAVVGVFDLALHLNDNAGPGFHLGPLMIDLGSSNLPLTLGSTLWAGGRAGFLAAFIVHGVLRRLGRISFADYGVGGALVGAASSLLFRAFGLSDDNWFIEATLGAASGVLYRLFAGAKVPV